MAAHDEQSVFYNVEDSSIGRERAWADALNRYFYDYNTAFPGDFAHGRIAGRSLGAFRTATIECDPMSVDRSREHVSRDPLDCFFMLFPVRSQLQFRQNGREVGIAPREFAFVSTGDPYSYRQNDPAAFHSLVIPGPMARARKPDVDDYVASDLGNRSMQELFRAYASSFCANAADFDSAMLKRMVDNMLDLFALVLAGADAHSEESSVAIAHRRRAYKLIETEFSDPEFGLEKLAQRLGVSPRYVQKIFAQSCTSVSTAIRKRRIQEACHLLENRQSSRLQISTIAYNVGFTDPAYFSRVFREDVGIPPVQYCG